MFVIPASVNATELAHPICPSILDNQTCLYISTEILPAVYDVHVQIEVNMVCLTGLLGVMSSIQSAAGKSPPHRSLFHPPPKIQEPGFVPNINIEHKYISDTARI